MSNKIEIERIQTLINYDIMDTPPEVELDEITKLASIICKTPISLITLIDQKRLWCKSNIGLESPECPREIAFCDYTIKQQDLLVVNDLLLDDRFNLNPLVTEGQLRFYAGMPLHTPCGYNIGTFCVIDKKPRNLNESQKFLLQVLAKQVITNFELRKNNKNLFKLNEETKKLSKSKEEFFSNISHELRTPLNAISGFTDILTKSKLEDPQREQLGIIRSSVDILISLINDILDFSKIDSGNLKIENHAFNLRTLIKTTYELLKIKAQEKSLSFITNVDKKIPSYVNGDKIRLNQILVNLIGNAIKFTSKGSVTIIVKTLKETEEETELYFSVKDSGIGIPPENVKGIFERFQQVEGTTRVFGGSGLGLCISKSLVELHNGKLEVKSEFGKGSEFSFIIKYRKSSPEEISNLIKEEKSNEFLSKPDFKNIKILLAEDNIINVKLIQKVFEGTGIHLEASENGKICIEKLKLNKYDLILMDMCMPEMNGYDATQYIRNAMKLDIPIVGLSASVSETDRRKCINGGMNDYVSKPFKIEELYKSINKLCKKGNQGKNIDEFKIVDKKTFKLKEKNNQTNLSHRKSENFTPISFIPLNPIKKPGKIKLNGSPIKTNHKLESVNRKKTNINSFVNLINPTQKFSSKSVLIESNLKGRNEFLNTNSLKEYSGNDDDFEKELIDMFLNEVPVYLKELEGDILNENFDSIKLIAHKVKSPLGIFGLSSLKNKFENIEEFCVKSQIVPIIKLFRDAKLSLEKVFIEMKDLLKTFNV